MVARAAQSEEFVFRIPMAPSRRVIAIVFGAILFLCTAYIPLKVGLTRFFAGLNANRGLLFLYVGLAAAVALFVGLAFTFHSAQPKLQIRRGTIRFVPSKLAELRLSEVPVQADIGPLSREILLCHSFIEELPDGYSLIVRADDGTERQVKLGRSLALDANGWRLLVDGIADATSLPVRLVLRRQLANGSTQEMQWVPTEGKRIHFGVRALLAICFALLPYFGGLLVVATRNIAWLTLAGIAICVLSTSSAYIVRRRRDPPAAKQWLIVDLILHSSEFVFTAVIVRYLFVR
jgi:hypothetical protein